MTPQQKFLENVYEVLAGNDQHFTQAQLISITDKMHIDYDNGHIDMVVHGKEGREVYRVFVKKLPRFEVTKGRHGTTIYDHVNLEERFIQGDDEALVTEHTSQGELAEYFN